MSRRDWTETPRSEDAESLWAALHDGSVWRIESDRLTRELRLHIAPGFPQPPEPYPPEVELCFTGVTHALLFTYWNWPGHFPELRTPLSEESEAAAEEHQRKSRCETSEFSLLNRWVEGDTQVEIMDADLHRTADELTMVLNGTTNDENSASGWQLRIAAEGFDVFLPDGSLIGLEELTRLGMAGWDR